MKSYDDIPHFIPNHANDSAAGEALFRADPIRFAQAAHATHGSIAKIHFNNQEWLLLTGAEANEFVWTNSQLWSYEKGRPGFLEEMGSEHVTSMDGSRHRLKRKIINKAFSFSANVRFLPRFQALFLEHIQTIVNRGPTDFTHYWAHLNAKINFQTIAQFDLPEEVIERLTDWQLLLMKGVLIQDKEKRHEVLQNENYLSYKKEALTVLQQLVEKRLRAPESVDDNFKLILDARKDLGEPWNIEALVNELYYITVAGVQNTTHFVNTALRELYNAPEWLAEILDELEQWDGSAINIANLEKLKATLMEIQRLRPQVIATPLFANTHFTYGPYSLPAKTWVLNIPAFLHFDASYYPDPFTFRPQRFLDKGKFAPKTFGFFGGGAHVCVGRNITQLHAPTMLANALKHYQFTGVDTPDTTLAGNIGGVQKSNTMSLQAREKKRS